MRTVQTYRGWRIRRHTSRFRTLDEGDQSTTWYTVFPAKLKPGRSY